MNTLKEVMKNEQSFRGVFPSIADSLIGSINGSTNIEKYRDYCVDVFYNELGDPRFTKYAARWDHVSETSRNIFLSWLAEKDLDLFFEIIDKTSVGRMWEPRKEFWKQYLPFITSTWVLFGSDAKGYADRIRHSKQAYGSLRDDKKQSVFAFQIKQYVFVEWSHNGKLRVWHAPKAPKIFGIASIHKDVITKNNDVVKDAQGRPFEVVHNGKWTNKVHGWINENCGVNP